MLNGFKTYLVAGSAIIAAIAAHSTHNLTTPEMMQAILTAVLAATVRNGMR